MQLNIATPTGPALVAVKELHEYEGIRFFIHQNPTYSGEVNASECRTGHMIPHTRAPYAVVSLALAKTIIDTITPAKIIQSMQDLPVINHE